MPSKNTGTTAAKKKMSVTVQAAIITTVGTIVVALITGFFALAPKNNTSSPTDTPIVLPTSTASISTATPSNIKMFGPENGQLKHDGIGGVEWKISKVSVRNFVAEATFINPYSSDEHKWDIVFFFRRIGDVSDFRIGISSEGVWGYGASLPEWKNVLSNAPFDKEKFNFKTGKGESNAIKLIAFDNQGCFYLNGKLLGELNLSLINEAGDIAVAIGSYNNSEQKDAVTLYENFTIYQLTEFKGCQ